MAGVAALCGGGWVWTCEEAVLPQPIPENTRAVTSSTAETEASRRAGGNIWILERNVQAKNRSAVRNASGKPGCGRRPPTGRRGRAGNSADCEGDSVEIVTVKGTATPFVTVKLEGTEHWAPKGAPEQARLIVPLKLGPRTTCRLYVAV